MKKLLSTILSIAMLATSAAVPVLADEVVAETEEIAVVETAEEEIIEAEAVEEEIIEEYFDFSDYVPCDYDVEKVNLNFDTDGTVVNDIDGTNAHQYGATEEVVFSLSDNTIMTKEFFLTFDFRLDTAEDGTVPGYVGINRSGKVGPWIKYVDNQLKTQTGSSSYQTLGDVTPDTWYTAEMEGKMVVAGAKVTFRLYSYVDGVKTLINTVDGMNLRQFYAGSSNGYPDYFRAYNISLDNVKLVSEYPDALVLSSTADEIDAGTTAAFDYVATRQDVETTKYGVVWSVWDEAGTTEITDGSAKVTSDGVLAADIHSPAQTVTVKATATLEGKELVGEYKVKINAVSTEDEKFDSIAIDGPLTVLGGTTGTFTFTASKNGEDVTSSVVAEDLVWSIYDCDDLKPNNSKMFNIENGVLTVDKSVIAQKIFVRATSASGKVYASKEVTIDFAADVPETIIGYNACETAIETAERVESFDGSSAYLTTTSYVLNFGDQGDYVAVEFDFRFPGSGDIRCKRADGSENSSFLYRDGTISQQTGGSKFSSVMAGLDTEAWYHFEFLYSAAAVDASCNIYKYNEDGSRELVNTTYGLNMRNGKNFGKIEFSNSMYVDNVMITKPVPNELEITAATTNMFAGNTNQITATASRNALPLKNASGLTWTVNDASDLPIIDGSVTITEAGLVTVDPLTKAQTVTVVAKASETVKATTVINIQSSDVFAITNIGVNEDMTKIVKIYAEKNFYYVDDITFVIAIYGEDGRLKAMVSRGGYGDEYSLGSNEINVDLDLPADFNPETDMIKSFVWTRF